MRLTKIIGFFFLLSFLGLQNLNAQTQKKTTTVKKTPTKTVKSVPTTVKSVPTTNSKTVLKKATKQATTARKEQIKKAARKTQVTRSHIRRR